MTRERQLDEHPSYGMASVARVSSTPGAVLFDSDIRHPSYLRIQIKTARRERDLHRDWIYDDKVVAEVKMSEAQWASFVSSINTNGVPCTLSFTQRDPVIPDPPFEPRLAVSMEETRTAADRAYARIKEAFAAVKDKPTKANIRTLEAAIENAPKNVEYAGEMLVEHSENVVQRARADIESMVAQHAIQLGIDPRAVMFTLEGPAEEETPELEQ